MCVFFATVRDKRPRYIITITIRRYVLTAIYFCIEDENVTVDLNDKCSLFHHTCLLVSQSFHVRGQLYDMDGPRETSSPFTDAAEEVSRCQIQEWHPLF